MQRIEDLYEQVIHSSRAFHHARLAKRCANSNYRRSLPS
jgi:hypothetical protein